MAQIIPLSDHVKNALNSLLFEKNVCRLKDVQHALTNNLHNKWDYCYAYNILTSSLGDGFNEICNSTQNQIISNFNQNVLTQAPFNDLTSKQTLKLAQANRLAELDGIQDEQIISRVIELCEVIVNDDIDMNTIVNEASLKLYLIKKLVMVIPYWIEKHRADIISDFNDIFMNQGNALNMALNFRDNVNNVKYAINNNMIQMIQYLDQYYIEIKRERNNLIHTLALEFFETYDIRRLENLMRA